MSVLSLLLDVLGPVVVICAIGAVAGPRLNIDIASLSRSAYWIFGPAFVFNLFTSTEVAGATALRLAAAALAGMVVAGGVAVALAPGAQLSGRRRRATVMTSAYGNVGNAGLAISAFALGPEALPAAGVVMVTINITGIMTGVALSSGSDQGLGTAVLRAVRSPMPIAAMAAFVVNVSGVELPLIVERPAGLLGDVMIPLMLFTLGLQLASSDRGGLVAAANRSSIMITSLAKLVAAPLAALLVARWIGLDGDDRAVVVVQSAMPPAVFCLLVALEYDLEPEQVTDNVVVVTLVALATVPLVLVIAT